MIAGVVSCWSGGLWQGAEAGPGGGYRAGPGPGSGDFQPVPPPAVGQPGGGAQDFVAQGFGFGAGQVAVQGQQPQPGQQGGRDQGGGQPGGVDREIV